MRRMREGDRWGRLSAVVDWRSERNAPRKKLSDMTRNTNVWDDLAAKGRLMRWPGEGDTGKKEWCIRIFLKGKWRAKGVCLCACTHAHTHTLTSMSCKHARTHKVWENKRMKVPMYKMVCLSRKHTCTSLIQHFSPSELDQNHRRHLNHPLFPSPRFSSQRCPSPCCPLARLGLGFVVSRHGWKTLERS